jgi:AcrR family transcriptional regulator
MPAADAPARRLLLDAALARFAQDGALRATLDEIRSDAGVSVGALYHHFADKSALAGALYVETLARYQEALLQTLDEHDGAEDGVRAVVSRTAAWCAQHTAEARLLFGGRGAADAHALAELNRPFFRRVTAWYRAHARYGALRELPVHLVPALWLGPALDHLRHDPEISPADVGVLADAAWRVLRGETST